MRDLYFLMNFLSPWLLLSVSSCSKLQQPSKSSRAFKEMFAASPSAQSSPNSPDWALNQVCYKTDIFCEAVSIPLFQQHSPSERYLIAKVALIFISKRRVKLQKVQRRVIRMSDTQNGSCPMRNGGTFSQNSHNCE